MAREINLKNFADVSEVHTEPFETGIGIKPAAAGDPQPRPDLDGHRVKGPGDPKIYLVDRGFRRWIPDRNTFNDLFRDSSGIVEDLLIFDIAEGLPFTSGTILARGSGTSKIYLIEPNSKRWIVNPHTMDVYNFSGDRAYIIPPVVLVSISDGPDISAP